MTTAGTAGTPMPAGYHLSGGQAEVLKGLQNKRVEIRGMFDSPAPGADASPSAMRTLRISAIRPVAGDCSAKR